MDGNTSKVNQNHVNAINIILNALDTATCLDDIDLTGRRLHPFKERNPIVWSLNVSGNWRITFEIEGGNVYNVSYLDTHK
jgi:proteic killer suppression protein